MNRINIIDLFAGCGGLTEGFEQSGLYNTLACVEWDAVACENLRNRLYKKWNMHEADSRVIRFDIQRTKELIDGFHDKEYGFSFGLKTLTGKEIDMIIGGPPCQAYSVAGRIRDKDGMKNDYRNFLFESYLEVVKFFKPKALVFENVPGILSAKPGDKPIVELIHEAFDEAGYVILDNLKEAAIEFSDYGVPQNRKRIIILGLNKEFFGNGSKRLLDVFYKHILPAHKEEKKMDVKAAIGDLPGLYPTNHIEIHEGIKTAHSISNTNIKNHISRFHNQRDIRLFQMLAEDIESGENQFESIEARKQLYTTVTGKVSNIHKYNVLKWNEPSTTIPAHLCKDGLRHIHPDPKQGRSITVREAARIQTFPDDYDFIGPMTEAYRMIGNAVPPVFANCLAHALYELLFD